MTKLRIPVDGAADTADELVAQLREIGLDFDHELVDDILVLDFTDADEVDGFVHDLDDTEALDIGFPVEDPDDRDAINEAEEILANLGVTFDTGTTFVGDAPTRCWQMDWSLEGATVELA